MIRYEYIGVTNHIEDNTISLRIYLIARNENIKTITNFLQNLLESKFRYEMEREILEQFIENIENESEQDISDFIETGKRSKVSINIILSHITKEYFYYLLTQRYHIYCDLLNYYKYNHKVPFAVACTIAQFYYFADSSEDLKELINNNYNIEYSDYKFNTSDFNDFKFLYWYYDNDFDMSDFEFQLSNQFFNKSSQSYVTSKYQKISDIPEYILDIVSEYLDISVTDIFEYHIPIREIFEIYNRAR